MPDKKEIVESFRNLQDRICRSLESVDGEGKFIEDIWSRSEGGGGRTRILRSGNVIEKGGVNFSEVYGQVTDLMKRNTEIDADEFIATGVSIVIHPNSPHVPIIHMNVRYFELSNGKYWFGGGIDLTPHYVKEDQAKKFHQGLKSICDKYNDEFYDRFKNWADDYFFVSHRNETRGIGGIFFDHLNESAGLSKRQLLDFCIELGDAFSGLYEYQVLQGKDLLITDHHKKWMGIRRGRYVEFNLVHDRGTKFGLVSGGRTESILMSLPPVAQWEYCFEVEQGSPEEHTLNLLKKGIDWLS